jgi:hypothetical protein
MTNLQLEIQVAKHTSNFPIAVVQRKALPDICTELVISPKIWSLTMGTYLAFPIKDGQLYLTFGLLLQPKTIQVMECSLKLFAHFSSLV